MQPIPYVTALRGFLRSSALVLTTLLAFSTPACAENVRIGGTGSALGTMALLAEAYRQVDPSFRLEIVPNLGSSGGITAVLAGSIDIAVTSRPLKANEAASGARAAEYGRTAFVLATTKTGIDTLSLSRIADLYSGRLRKWDDGQAVRLVLRPASDGDTALLAQFSPAIKESLDIAMAREGMVTAMTDQDAADAIERLPGGLGTSSVALLMSERRRARPLAIEGVAPTLENVANGRYPYVKTMYFVVRNGAPASIMKFVDFAGSAAGRRVLAEAGHVVPAGR